MPARSLRLRVGGLTLSVTARAATPALDAPKRFRPFFASRGGDIRLKLVEDDPPSASPEGLLFESGGAWQVSRRGSGLLYTFRAPGIDPPVYKAVAIDAALSSGTLYFPVPRRGVRPAYALDYPLDELLFQHRLVKEDALEIHACGLVHRGTTLLFCGRSGAGKSTTARLWRRHRPRSPILSDDRIVLRVAPRAVRAYGTPWHGDGGFARPLEAPLRAVFFLGRAEKSNTRRLPAPESAARLLARSFPPPWDPDGLASALDTCARVVAAVPCFHLGFRPGATAITAALRALGQPG